MKFCLQQVNVNTNKECKVPIKPLNTLCTYQTRPEKGAGQSGSYPARQFTRGAKIIGKMWLVISGFHMRKNLSQYYQHFGHEPARTFVKTFKEYRFDGETNYKPGRDAHVSHAGPCAKLKWSRCSYSFSFYS